ncbi:FadR/GntR family transcriptional regulator [Planobispora longispora]|uniref:GntR family transcriptional regulator n=1 Tax=Planobispora longispora TaxID=28887 RepID=A0A8J3RH31_9ACTN|nr:GntR family transcriptional regulator [Planobispora longispora]BFE88989.1 FCD domain-containing protein [Planobispora longispora]GIH74106.1 GntR family transcriptional regulator [Planobispora longispora]
MGEPTTRWRSRLAAFAPVDSTARVDAVVRRLTDAIALGLLADGEQLPSEAELAAQLGVSTVTLREALMALRQQGMVETRRGRGGGSFVRVPEHAPSLTDRLRGLTAEELRDLGDHYAAIAGAAARLAAQRALPEDLAPLRRTLEEMAATGDEAHLRRLHGRFHIEVAAVSQSARLTQEEIRLQADIGPLLWLAHTGEHGPSAQHRAIAEAVHRGDGDRARDLAERHVLEAVEHLIELRLREP